MSPSKPQAHQRIAKLLARAGVASRREVERMIAEGRVSLGGVAVDTPATLLGSLQGVTVDGQPVGEAAPARLFLYHKPPGLLVTERDPAGRPTIYDRLPPDLPRLVPVGRLDLNTEGLLLLTTDGTLKRQLELPSTGVERAYRARAYGDVTQDMLEALAEGVEIEGIRYGSIDANLERRTGANVWIELILTEGKNREVRRVLDYLGMRVSRLIRTRYGPFVLADLPAGAIGEVRQYDLETFRAAFKRAGGKVLERVAVEPGDHGATRPARTRPVERTAHRGTDGPRDGARPTLPGGSRAARPERPVAPGERVAASKGRVARPKADRTPGRPDRAGNSRRPDDRPPVSGTSDQFTQRQRRPVALPGARPARAEAATGAGRASRTGHGTTPRDDAVTPDGRPRRFREADPDRASTRGDRDASGSRSLQPAGRGNRRPEREDMTAARPNRRPQGDRPSSARGAGSDRPVRTTNTDPAARPRGPRPRSGGSPPTPGKGPRRGR